MYCKPKSGNYARYEQDKENADFSSGAYKAYVTEKKRKFDKVLQTEARKNYARYEQDKENADFSTGAYIAYVTEKKRKFDKVLQTEKRKLCKIRARQGKRGFFDGSVHSVRDREKTQV